MTQRDVTDTNATTWACVQAYSSLPEEKAAKAAALSDAATGQVPVVCTPTGGAKSVRVELPENWQEEITDEDLLAAIAAAHD